MIREAEEKRDRSIYNKQKQNKQLKTGQSPVSTLAYSYLISKFILLRQLHTQFVYPCWQRQFPSQRATVFTYHLLISATKPSKHDRRGRGRGERESVEERGRAWLKKGISSHNKSACVTFEKCEQKLETQISETSSIIHYEKN